MPWYNDLRPTEDNKKQDYALIFPEMKNYEKERTIRNLLHLRQYLDFNVEIKKNDNNLLLASWNIKEFGHLKKRLPDSYFYIAEIINRFDLIAVQEVKSTLDDLLIIMRLLGKDWAYLINDITGGRAGNSERFAYIYNTKRVEFSGLAGEIVLWDKFSENLSIRQLKRTPYITGFRSGWKSFAIINVHLNPDNTPAARELRLQEVKALAEAIKDKVMQKSFWTENLILTGDFNLYADNKDIMKILDDYGFKELQTLSGQPTNVTGTESYDKIYFRENKYFTVPKLTGRGNGGVLKFFDAIYRMDQFADYKTEMLNHKGDSSSLNSDEAFKTYFERYWRKIQMSDHYPIWLELLIDNSDDFLQDKLKAYI